MILIHEAPAGHRRRPPLPAARGSGPGTVCSRFAALNVRHTRLGRPGPAPPCARRFLKCGPEHSTRATAIRTVKAAFGNQNRSAAASLLIYFHAGGRALSHRVASREAGQRQRQHSEVGVTVPSAAPTSPRFPPERSPPPSRAPPPRPPAIVAAETRGGGRGAQVSRSDSASSPRCSRGFRSLHDEGFDLGSFMLRKPQIK